ncbi:helix-turn-helix transcriptional regulator [Heyndrickxia coagulans]|uniref:Helix-turn-helix transcriptional regulator n=1 Tax=Heyndrickxia coagulans TaxID=1398 RepID=A0AAW7CTR2_HEYCO|nr:helix-turn-helix transcriptional regulator [Heyndrickxia coagulans]MDL5042010.1 helix-turn-helix transcriptional regulator [Heyndrickxia coagulans]
MAYIIKPRLKELLEKSEYSSQKEFAKAVGVREPTISRFDSQSRYDIVTLVAISRTLGVTIDDLFHITWYDPFNPDEQEYTNETLKNKMTEKSPKTGS